MTRDEIDEWFVQEILPLEGVLKRFLRRNWRDTDELPDLRQEVYARVLEARAATRPDSAQAFMLSTARNLLIDRTRRARIVSIETFADMDAVEIVPEGVPLERNLAARSELRLLQRALEVLPLRCRQVVELRKIEGLSQREVAHRMGITEHTVERQVSIGVRALADAMACTGSASEDSSAAPAKFEGAASA